MNKKLDKRNIKIVIVSSVTLLLLYFNFPDIQNGIEKNNIFIHDKNNPRYSLSVCTNDLVEQDECYSGDFPTPLFRWSCDESNNLIDYEYTLALEVDDNSYFLSPEFSSGEIRTNNLFYKIAEKYLESGVEYYWRVKIQNEYGTWSDWAESGVSVVISPMCD